MIGLALSNRPESDTLWSFIHAHAGGKSGSLFPHLSRICVIFSGADAGSRVASGKVGVEIFGQLLHWAAVQGLSMAFQSGAPLGRHR